MVIGSDVDFDFLIILDGDTDLDLPAVLILPELLLWNSLPSEGILDVLDMDLERERLGC